MRRFKSEIDEGLYSNFFGQVLGDDNPEKEKYRKDFEGWEFKGHEKVFNVNALTLTSGNGLYFSFLLRCRVN